MARDTQYKLYKTGRTDPTFTNIWGFSNAIERDGFLNSKASLTFNGQKYWRVGNNIKIPIRYEASFEYDYIRIANDTTNANLARNWYCFITARAYLSPEVTLLTLSVDWIQTFYFDSGVPFWRYNGFITKSTSGILPPVGTPSDYPVPNVKTESFAYESSDYAIILYATIAPNDAESANLAYTSTIIDGVPMTAAPYVLYKSTAVDLLAALAQTVSAYNSAGYTDAISGMYLLPSDYVSAIGKTGEWVACSTANVLVAKTVEIAKPNYTLVFNEYADLVSEYGYFNLVINNGQGETVSYNFNEFDGNPRFNVVPTVTAGSPTLICQPANLKFTSLDVRNRLLKITQAPATGWLNDSYKIWLAQTQNSRAAAIDSANLSIAQAEEARSNSWAYKYGNLIKFEEQKYKSEITGSIANTLGDLLGMEGERVSSTGRSWGDSITPTSGIDASAITERREGSKYKSFQNRLGMLYDFGMAYLNKQLGIETTYQFDQNVATAQQQLNVLLASYKDKARIPATASGSNAYGDVVKFKQYGFMFTVFVPDNDSMILIYQMIAAGGHTTNKYQQIAKWHGVFDYVQANSVKIPVNTSSRPEFVRKMMLDTLQRGVYLWYLNNGDISQYYGSPYGLTNPVSV